MGLVAKEGGGGNFMPVQPGTHLARCYRIVDLGTQKTEYLGTVKHLPKVMLQFEVHGEDDAGQPMVTSKGEPMTISKNFTLSLAEKATLRRDLQSWRGRDFTADELRGFELKNVLGQWAMIAVSKTENNGNEYTNIVNINAIPKQIKTAGLPNGVNPLALFSIDDPDMELFNSFSEGLKAKISKSPEWMRRTGSVPAGVSQGVDALEDDIPF